MGRSGRVAKGPAGFLSTSIVVSPMTMESPTSTVVISQRSLADLPGDRRPSYDRFAIDDRISSGYDAVYHNGPVLNLPLVQALSPIQGMVVSLEYVLGFPRVLPPALDKVRDDREPRSIITVVASVIYTHLSTRASGLDRP